MAEQRDSLRQARPDCERWVEDSTQRLVEQITARRSADEKFGHLTNRERARVDPLSLRD